MFNIKISYFIVLVSLIFWASFAYFTMHEQISNQQKYAKLINISGKQRMLSQKTTLMAKRVFETNDPILIEHLDSLVNLMKNDHQFMLNNLATPHMSAIYHNKPYSLDTNVKQYFILLDDFNTNQNLKTLRQIEEYSFTLLGKLNYAVNEFEKESDLHTTELMQRELIIFIGTLLTLLLEALLIIIPTIRKIDESKKQQSLFNQTLQEKVEEQKKIILEDALEKKENEKIIQEQERQASIGDMIGNIAHQWRQPLSAISTSASGMKLQKEYGLLKDDEFYRVCDSIDDNAQYLSNTIGNFNNLIKKDKIKTKYYINDEINNMIHLMNETFIEEKIDVTLNFKEEIEINGYKNELSQSIINILNNSVEALNVNKVSSKNIDITIYLNKKEELKIKIKDNAGGIPEEIFTKIFDPYFTTKYQAQGTGLGLHMVYKFIVQNMNGTIKAKNVEYIYNDISYLGAEFTITLPTK